MRVLLAVVDAGSLSAGSRRLNAPLPSVSRKVADPERHLGANLIIRTSRNLQLTDAGREYVEAARKIMADLEEAERRASGEYQAPRGTLKITMPVEFGNRYVLPIALSFLEKYPEVSLNLLSLDRSVDLVSEQVDIPDEAETANGRINFRKPAFAVLRLLSGLAVPKETAFPPQAAELQ